MKLLSSKSLKILLILCALIILACQWRYFSAYLTYHDAIEYADVARNIINNDGMTTQFIFPEYFRFVNHQDSQPWFSYWPPLQPIVLAGAFQLLEANDQSVILTSSFFFLLSIFFLYFLAKRMFNKEVAFISVILYISTPEMLWYSTSGLAEPLFIFLIILSFLCLIKNQSYLDYFFSGLIIGLAHQARPVGIIFGLALCLWILLHKLQLQKRGLSLISFLVGFFVISIIFKWVILPCLGGNTSFHSRELGPFLYNTSNYPSDFIMRTPDYLTPISISSLLSELSIKFILNFRIIITNIFTNTDTLNFLNNVHRFLPRFLLLFFVIALMFRSSDIKHKNLKIMILTLIILHIILVCLTITTAQMRYFHTLGPFIIILISKFIIDLCDQINSMAKKSFLSPYLVLIVCLLCFQLPDLYKNFAYKASFNKLNPNGPYYPLGKSFENLFDSNSIIVSNLGGWGTWYSRRKTIFYPNFTTDLTKLQNYSKIDAILIFEELFEDVSSRRIWNPLIYQPKDFDNFHFERIVLISLNSKETIKAALYRKQFNNK